MPSGVGDGNDFVKTSLLKNELELEHRVRPPPLKGRDTR